MKSTVNASAKILPVVFVLALLAAVAWNYSTFFIDRDYLVYSEISCDPEMESCFSWVCGEEDNECDDSPYKKIELAAASLPLCDMYTNEECPEPTCNTNDETCTITYCSDETLEEGEICTDFEETESEREDDGDETSEEANMEEVVTDTL